MFLSDVTEASRLAASCHSWPWHEPELSLSLVARNHTQLGWLFHSHVPVIYKTKYCTTRVFRSFTLRIQQVDWEHNSSQRQRCYTKHHLRKRHDMIWYDMIHVSIIKSPRLPLFKHQRLHVLPTCASAPQLCWMGWLGINLEHLICSGTWI